MMNIMIDPEIPAWYLMSPEGSRQTINVSYHEAVKRRDKKVDTVVDYSECGVHLDFDSYVYHKHGIKP